MIRIEQLRFGYRDGDDVLQLEEFVLEPQSNALSSAPLVAARRRCCT